MNTEITDARSEGRRAWLFYDGNCSLCIALARRFTPFLRRLGFRLAPLQTPWVRQTLGLPTDAQLSEMRVLLPDGQSPGGADALLAIARRTAWGWPLLVIAKVPGVTWLLRKIYGALAARRHCLNGFCSIPIQPDATTQSAPSLVHWFPLAGLVALTLAVRSRLAPWIFMWAMVSSIFLGFKWLMLANKMRAALKTNPRVLAAWFFLCPGMEPHPFLTPNRAHFEWAAIEKKFLSAALRLSLGTPLVFFSAHAFTLAPLARGWLGMLGIVLFLHFGIFDLLALVLRKHGFAVKPVMRKPLGATSLSDFWGKRWNTAFSQLAHTLILLPLKRRLGRSGATLAVFLMSGLLHELVISVPARAGYGLPTTYFLLQGFAIRFERSPLGARAGLGRGWRGRIFALLIAGLPAFWLFHPPFIKNVVLPMLDAIARIKIL